MMYMHFNNDVTSTGLTLHYRETGMEGKLSHAERGLEECVKFSSIVHPKMEELLNAHKLHQLKRDLIGVDRLLSYKPNRVSWHLIVY